MKEKGFTLIELLAVIVILAIIALIATPIILGIIKDTKIESTKISAENYLDAVNQAIIRKNFKQEFKPSVCEVTGNELDCEEYNEKLKIEVDGDTSIKGIILFENNIITKGSNFILNDYIVKISEKGELTIKPIPSPKSFAEDSWETIIANVRKGNISVYESNLESDTNNTKEITLTSEDTNISGTYTVRIANTQTPDECETEGFSQTACGFVIEFEDIIINYNVNPIARNKGGWRDSDIRKYINDYIYKAFSQELRENIKTTKVISGHGTEDTADFETIDKLYLLSPREVYEGLEEWIDTAKNKSRQLDYYNKKDVIFGHESNARKSKDWWLRSSCNHNGFNMMYSNGGWNCLTCFYENIGISPAFRIG